MNLAPQECGFATFSLDVIGAIQLVPRGLHRDSKIPINSCLVTRLEATDRTKSTSSSSLKVASQSFMSRKVMAALAPTRLFPSMNA